MCERDVVHFLEYRDWRKRHQVELGGTRRETLRWRSSGGVARVRTRAGVHLMFPISHHIDTLKPGEKPGKLGESTVRRQGVTCQNRM